MVTFRGKPHYTLEEMAEKAGVSRHFIKAKCMDCKIPGAYFVSKPEGTGYTWIIKPESEITIRRMYSGTGWKAGAVTNYSPAEYIPASLLAMVSQCTTETIRNAVKRGDIEGIKTPKGYMVKRGQTYKPKRNLAYYGRPSLDELPKGYILVSDLMEIYKSTRSTIHTKLRNGEIPGAYKETFYDQEVWLVPEDTKLEWSRPSQDDFNKEDVPDGYITVRDYSELHGVPERRVQYFIESGKIKDLKAIETYLGKPYAIPESTVVLKKPISADEAPRKIKDCVLKKEDVEALCILGDITPAFLVDGQWICEQKDVALANTEAKRAKKNKNR